MTACPDCVSASERLWHAYTAGCRVCEARRIARGPLCAEARSCGFLTPAYMAELRAVAGDDWQPLHELVRRCEATMKTTTHP